MINIFIYQDYNMELVVLVLGALIITLGLSHLNENSINKAEKEAKLNLKKILINHESFSAKGSNCDLIFHNDYFQFKFKGLIEEFDWKDVKFEEITSIEYRDPRLGIAKIVINLISGSKIILGFGDSNEKRGYTYHKNYFLVKLFLENFKN